MNKKINIYSLRYRMVIVLGLSLAIAGSVYFLATTVANRLIENNYSSDEAYSARTTEYAQRFNEYVKARGIFSQDNESLKKWVRDNPYSYMTIYDEYGMIWESGWWDDTVDTKLVADSTYTEGDAETSEGTVNLEVHQAAEVPDYYYDYYYPIEFTDGVKWLAVTDFSDSLLYDISGKAVTAFSVFLVFPIVLYYSSKISKRVIKLTGEVHTISSGDLNGRITIHGKDEIAILADGVDTMRRSVIDQLEKEQIAWRANSDLITSMSHDIRTPLTVLLGYTGLIKNKQYSSQEEFDSYVDVIEKKSLQLKELSDKLFQYFLVFGSAAPVELEAVNAKDIFPQILVEHTVLMADSGFQFEGNQMEEPCTVRIELNYLKRLFDNVFSNVEKYGDKSVPCGIWVEQLEGRLILSVTNGIRHDTQMVESTRIGLKTCEKITEQMNGRFSTQTQENLFTVRIEFPIVPAEPELDL